MSCTRKIGPFDCCSVVQGDCLELMKSLPSRCADLVFADPPYGVGKASWDGVYREGYEGHAVRVGRVCAFTPGIINLGDCILNSQPEYSGVISARNLNGMARGPLGFGNWIPVVICGKVAQGPDAFEFCVTGEMPEHPSPKPIEFMEQLLARLTDYGDLVIDAFLGSGTTAVAAKKLGRHFLGFEISPEYCRIARERIARVEAQPNLFEPKPEQLSLV